MNIWTYPSPWGAVTIQSREKEIVHVYLPGRKIPQGLTIFEDDVLKEAGRQLHDYLNHRRQKFNLPLAPEGSDFMLSVWKLLQDIPYGDMTTYKEIAEALNRPKAFRAVGMANARNPLAIFIPCHRVIGSDGSLTGFGGGLSMKKGLLALEKEGVSKQKLGTWQNTEQTN